MRFAPWLAFLLSCTAHAAAAAADSAAAPAATGYSAAALYNQGNAYARADHPGLAVLNYERARLLTPDDPDLLANLHHVRDIAKLPSPPVSRVERYARIAGPTWPAWLGVLGVLLLGSGWLLGRVRAADSHPWARRSGMVVGAGLIVVAVVNALLLWPLLHEAVVLTAATPVRVAPVPMGEPLFVLPEGETVTMTGAHDEYVLIATRAGRTGWAARVNLGAVIPDR